MCGTSILMLKYHIYLQLLDWMISFSFFHTENEQDKKTANKI